MAFNRKDSYNKMNLSHIALCFLIIFPLTQGFAQKKNILLSLLNSRKDLFGEILQNQEKYEVQIIYTQIDRDKQNHPHFTSYTYGLDKDRYFYPASVVKLPIALLALEKINRLKIKGLDKHTPMFIEAAREPQDKVEKDSTSSNGYASVAHYIKKLFIVSDNDAYNRLYEFLGQAYINENLWKKGYKDVQIIHRLSAPDFDFESNRYTNPVYFETAGNKIYSQPEIYNPKAYERKIKNPLKGIAYIDKDGKKIEKPYDFSEKNVLSLNTMHEILKSLLFPYSVKPEKRFLLTEDDYHLVYRSMSQLPRESKYPVYNKKYHTDGFVKFLMFGDSKDSIPKNIRIFNKVGTAYGFLVENAYFIDFETKTEFLLSAVIYNNGDNVLNDGKYEYEKIGFPFFANLGKVIYWHEKNRSRKNLPDLRKFIINYKE